MQACKLVKTWKPKLLESPQSAGDTMTYWLVGGQFKANRQVFSWSWWLVLFLLGNPYGNNNLYQNFLGPVQLHHMNTQHIFYIYCIFACVFGKFSPKNTEGNMLSPRFRCGNSLELFCLFIFIHFPSTQVPGQKNGVRVRI